MNTVVAGRRRRGRRWGMSAVGMVMAATAAAFGQEGVGGVLQRSEPHDWTLSVHVSVRAYQHIDTANQRLEKSAFDFTSAAVVFPMIDGTASSQTKPPPDSGGQLTVQDRVSDANPQILSEYPCGTKLGKWKLVDWKGDEVGLDVKLQTTCWQTKFDEAAATKLGWPQAWSGVAQTCFTPQLFVEIMPGEDPKAAEAHMQIVRDLVKKWTNGKDPKSVPPVMLAKVITGEVLRLVQVSGNGLTYARTGEVQGLELQGAAETAHRGRGSEFDMVSLLCAAFRQAGLPARTVIGWDVGESKRDKNQFLGKKGSGQLRGWVEFALADPSAQGGITWVPVDVVRLRKSSTRPPPYDKPWPFFGTSDELDGVIPFAFQFHPPTTVVAHGSPAFWGWLVTPAPPENPLQAVRFEAVTTAKNAEQQKKDREQRDKKRGGR